MIASSLLQDAFIVDTGAGGVYGWVGKGATQQEKKAAYQCALVRISVLINTDGRWYNTGCYVAGLD